MHHHDVSRWRASLWHLKSALRLIISTRADLFDGGNYAGEGNRGLCAEEIFDGQRYLAAIPPIAELLFKRMQTDLPRARLPISQYLPVALYLNFGWHATETTSLWSASVMARLCCKALIHLTQDLDREFALQF